ncbi:unnamed protein product [Hymenolepis diminuta]|uniref:Uncharacterized protein n=1 Tax=Hymenolepis diminuta TaxID=6216 RepID=A0A564YHT5_HYMDI|nr:unnamed protein product [Hymenolepis diminuta]
MTDLSHATPITMVLREFNGSNNYLCSAYFQSMDSADLTCEKMISKLGSVDGDNSPLFNLTISEDQNIHAVIRLRLLFLLDKKPDVKKSCYRLESARGLLTVSVQLERT